MNGTGSNTIGSENGGQQFPDFALTPPPPAGYAGAMVPSVRLSGFVRGFVPAVAAACVGCAGMDVRRPSGPLVTRSADGTKQLAPAFSTAVYESSNVAAAEIYLTDLPIDRLTDPRDTLSGLSGSIVQVRLFLIPKAGNTPISDTSCNVTIRQLVLGSASADAIPEVGIYGGGGFLFPSGEPGSKSISGTIVGATLRPMAWSGGFIDRLGASEMSGGFSARQDAQAARALNARMQRLFACAEIKPAVQSTSIASPNE